MENGKLIIIVAPSGTGKSSLIKRLRENFPQLKESVSYTTRARRPNETEGVDYFYIDEGKFKQMIDDDSFIEWAIVHGDYKGTSKHYVEKKMKEGHHMLFDLDIQGTDAFKKVFPKDAIGIFIEPPSFEDLESRLRGRGTESEETLKIRLENAKKELSRKDDYDYNIVNDDLEKAYSELHSLIEKLVSK